MMEDEGARLLDLLQAHGQQFLNSFELNQNPRKKQKLEESPKELENEDFEEWGGFSNAAVSTHPSEEDDNGTPDEYDDGFTASSSTKIPDVVVFSDSRQKPSEQFSKAQKKAFMASLMYCYLRVLIQE
ncbi:uncharacterized protein HD556DRAFT_350554 [Suillus plorans]|uniref:Uncharacterized protein n=1 Tax=Suillus plorans TaxID=116603 RepID=A0A9P7J7G8_9AGAM|nr:uncharacterized protein HD556DRAFT_350554 [Suillus plorans]KAG1806898.1 hypothetical protein HD556DRAFT_350554 [Suillus plorans]